MNTQTEQAKPTYLFAGQRVILAAMPEEGLAEERGVLLDIQGDTALVQVDAAYKMDILDDGLRECPIEQVKGVMH